MLEPLLPEGLRQSGDIPGGYVFMMLGMETRMFEEDEGDDEEKDEDEDEGRPDVKEVWIVRM